MRAWKKMFLFFTMALAISILFTLNTDSIVCIRAYWGNYLNQSQGKSLNKELQTKIKSGNLSTDYEIEQVLKDIDSLELNTLNVPVAVTIENLASSTMELDVESVRKAKVLLKRVRGRKLNILLEPYPWIANGECYETNWNPEDVELFFQSWRQDVIKPLIEKVAVPYHVDALCIASNLVHLEGFEDAWCEVIDFARDYYKGLITYKSNWWYTAKWEPDTYQEYEKKLENRIFSKVDFISFAAYFELSDESQNSVEQLKKSLYSTSIMKRQQNIVDEVEGFYNKWGKKVFFGELGFPRRDHAATHPWNPSPSNVENGKEQARCFTAYREVFNQEWFLGFSVFAIGNHTEDKHYYPSEQSKRIIKEWFTD